MVEALMCRDSLAESPAAILTCLGKNSPYFARPMAQSVWSNKTQINANELECANCAIELAGISVPENWAHGGQATLLALPGVKLKQAR